MLIAAGDCLFVNDGKIVPCSLLVTLVDYILIGPFGFSWPMYDKSLILADPALSMNFVFGYSHVVLLLLVLVPA